MRHLLRAKAVLCPGLTVRLFDEATGERNEWFFQNGLRDYLQGELGERERIPAELFSGNLAKENEIVDWAVAWLPENDGRAGEAVQESYVNLIPTAHRSAPSAVH